MTPSPEATQALETMRPDLLRFARLQLRDTASAEDAVQDALLVAFSSLEKFANRSSLKTWVFSILRNKIVDTIRTRSREMAASSMGGGEAEDDNLIETLFDQRGHWHGETAPQRWQDPEDSLSQSQFWLIFEACLDQLPEKTARVFSMRELLGLETDEICKEVGISTSNCWVVLHRARLTLRTCLDQRWFANAA